MVILSKSHSIPVPPLSRTLETNENVLFVAVNKREIETSDINFPASASLSRVSASTWTRGHGKSESNSDNSPAFERPNADFRQCKSTSSTSSNVN